MIQIERVFWDRDLGRGISGARKIWRLLRREGVVVARCTVERLMRQQGLPIMFNVASEHRPNELWVVDFTYVPTRSGMAFTAFTAFTDVFSRRIVGWRLPGAVSKYQTATNCVTDDCDVTRRVRWRGHVIRRR